VIFHLHSKNEENNNTQTASNNAYEREIEQLLVAANLVIAKQKDALQKAQDGTQWKEKVGQLEAAHLQERQESQAAFKGYRGQIEQKEKQLAEAHSAKVEQMRVEVLDLKKGFDTRC
jgi:hypothetical protein